MSFRAVTHANSEIFNSLEIDSREPTNKRYNSALPRRRLKSAGLISQKRTTISQSTTPSKQQQPSGDFFRKMNTFISAISQNEKKLADGIFNSPLADNYCNTNRFRATFNRRSSRLRKFKKPLIDQQKELELFMKTVTQEFGIAKTKFSLQLPPEGQPASPLHLRKLKPPPTFSLMGRHHHHRTFQSQSSVRFRKASKDRLIFSVEGQKCF